MTIRESKTIKALKNKASKGDISASFLLSQFYLIGQFVEKDPAVSKKYFDEVIQKSKAFNFRINELQLINFRRFEDITLTMPNDNLTVIIGNNGAGKTSILEAITKSLSWFVNNVIREDTTGQKFNKNDVCNSNMAPYTTVKSTIQFHQSSKHYVELSTPRISSESGVTGDYAQIKLIADMYRHINSKVKDFNLPIVAYYPIERTQDAGQIHQNKIERISYDSWNSSDGYDLSLSSHQNFNRFLGWYKKLSNINLSTNSEYSALANAIAAKEELLIVINQQLSKSLKVDSVPLISIKETVEDEIKGLIEQLGSTKLSPVSKNLTIINNAILAFMSELKNIRYENHPEDGFFVDKNNVKLEARQLSQGERTLIALIGDIARRLIFLNPSLDNPLHGNGIILIDEIELHIHPALQQVILPNLASTFPNVQFIVTTHSPQVLSTSDVSTIRVLSENEDLKSCIYKPIFQTKGVTSSDILANIMGTTPIPKIKESQLLEDYLNFLENDGGNFDINNPEYQKLLKHFGKEHPLMVNVERVIRLKKLKSKVESMLKRKKS